MYSGSSGGSAWASGDHPAGSNNSGRNTGARGDGDYLHDGQQPTNYRSWEIVAATLENTKGFRGAKKDVICSVIRTLGRSLTPTAIAEIIILIGKVLAATQADTDQLESARATLVEAIDGSGSVNWDAVFVALPQVDRNLKINSLECFAFFMAMFRSKAPPDMRFPIEIGFRGGWVSTLSQALFLKWVVVSVAATSASSPYQHVPMVVHLRVVEVAPDAALLEACPPLFSADSSLTSLWSNAQLVAALANIASSGAAEGASDPEDAEAARIAFELLKRPTANSPDVLLSALVKSPETPPALARPLAAECVDQLWTMLTSSAQQHRLPATELALFFRSLASLCPSRFGSVVLASLYPRNPERVETVVAALQPDTKLLSIILNGPPSPFCFHAVHVAKSPSFFPALWLKERLQNDDSESVIKDFIFFLTLALCPAKLLQQHQQKAPQLATTHPMRRLHIGPRDLLLYLYVVAEAMVHRKGGSPSSTAQLPGGNGPASSMLGDNSVFAELASVDLTTVATQSREALIADISKLKQIIGKLDPQLSGILEFIQHSGSDDDADPAGSRGDNASATGGVTHTNSTTFPLDAEIDAEVNRQFSALYAEEITCAEMVAGMEKMAATPASSPAYKVFDRMVQLLFRECRFFPKYPLFELAITAELMGRLIDSGVLMAHGKPSNGTHVLALRSILEALRKGPGSKMFGFAVTAMEYFIGPRLAAYPDFLVALSTGIPDVRKYLPSYVEFAEKCLQELPPELRGGRVLDAATLAERPLPPAPPPVILSEFSLSRFRAHRPGGPGTALSRAPGLPSQHGREYELAGTNALLAQTPLGGPHAATASAPGVPLPSDGLPPQRPLVVDGCPVSLGGFGLGTVEQLLSSEPALQTLKPPQVFCDQVAQLFNSLVLSNVQQKAHDLRNILQPEWHPFLALYIVKSRASKETSFHETYIQLVEAVGRPKLLDTVTTTTYDCISVLLSYCDAAKDSVSYRKVLKNLGSWLGTITIARNKPLKSKAIDLKNLLFDGYENGRLRALLPLCCKILDSVKQSKNFRPPNPWSVAMFSLLAEIHGLPGLITPLVFELELFFKNLNLSIHEFKGRTNHLARRRAPPIANSPDFFQRDEPQQFTPAPCATVTPSGAAPEELVAPKQPVDFRFSRHILQQQQLQQQLQQQRVHVSPSHATGPVTQVPRPYMPEGAGMDKLLANQPQSTSVAAEPFLDNKVTASAVASVLGSDAALVRAFGPALVPASLTPGGDDGSSNTKQSLKAPLGPHPQAATASQPAAPDFSRSAPNSAAGAAESSLLKGLMKSVVISPSLVLFQLKPAFKAVIPHAIECAVKEIVQVVAERSVTISCVTAREIVLKDFVGETDENVIHRASHLFVASLAGSLALVTCREPLRAAFNQHLRSYLLSASNKLGEDQRLVDQVVAVTTADNIELGCALVEEAVVQRALQKIEEFLQPVLLARKQARSAGRPFHDPAHMNSRWPGLLPPALQPRSPPTAEQLQVYKDFILFGPLYRMQPANDARPQQSHAPSAVQPPTPAASDSLFPSASGFSAQVGPSLAQKDTSTQLADDSVRDAARNNFDHTNSQAALPPFSDLAAAAGSGSSDSNTYPTASSLTPTGGGSTAHPGSSASTTCPAAPSSGASHFSVGTSIDLQAVLMRVEESLSHIKDVVHEIAFCSPTLGFKSASTLKTSMPLGSTLDVLPIPRAVNVFVSTLARLPSDHEIFAAVMAPSVICSFCRQPEVAYLSVCQRILRMINDIGVLYRERRALVRVSDVAGLYLEVFLGLLAYVAQSSPVFPKTQFHHDIVSWIPSVLSEKAFGADVVIGLLRYQLVSFPRLDAVLVEQTESKGGQHLNMGLLDNILRIAFQVASQTQIDVPDVKAALRDLKGTCDFIRQLPDERLQEPSPSAEGLSGAVGSPSGLNAQPGGNPPETGDANTPPSELSPLCNNVITVGELAPMTYIQARQDLVARMANNTEASEETTSTHQDVSAEPIISSFTELLEHYATLGGHTVRVRRMPDPPELSPEHRESVAAFFQQWTSCSSLPGSERRTKAYASYFQALSNQRFLEMDDETDRFLTGCIERAIELSLNDGSPRPSANKDSATRSPALDAGVAEDDVSSCPNHQQATGHSSDDTVGTRGGPSTTQDPSMETVPETESSPTSLKPLSVFAKMIVAMMRLGDASHVSPLLILQRTLSVLVRCVYRDTATGVCSVNALAYYRILLSLLWEVSQPSRGLDHHALSCLLCFSNTFQSLSPCECPQFAFCWLELIANSAFLPAILSHARAWPHFQRLISRLFRFLYPFHQNVHLTPGILALYKGTLRLLLVLLHDFPEFLCEHHVVLTENLPFNSIQLRNLILSAFPRNTRLPDPFMPNLKVDLLPETRKAPRVSGNYLLLLLKSGIKADLDQFCRTQNVQHILDVIQKLKLSDDRAVMDTGIHYNVSLINATLLHLASQFPAEKDILNSKTPTESTAPVVNIAHVLIEQLDDEGRYVVISCISNHLRYPNMHTHYFSCLLLWLFGACTSLKQVQEQITRVLLERLIAHRPHPWGLLITFIELIKNPRFNFWSCPFVHAVPEVQKLFQSVAQTCLGQPNIFQANKANVSTTQS